MSKAVIMQAAAAAVIEEYCDQCQMEIEKTLAKQKLFLRPRFSPGYGDFDLIHQKDFIALFGVGTGGSGLEFGSVAEKDIKRRDVPDLIPLRANTVITGDEADKYYLQKENTDGTNYWYLKEFAQDIIIKTWWKDGADDEADGTEITSDIHESTRTEGIQSFAELVLDFNTSDVREYFEFIGSLNSARYNSIGIYTGQKKVIGDREEYVNVRLFSYLNIDNKSVKIKTASQYIYRILALV